MVCYASIACLLVTAVGLGMSRVAVDGYTAYQGIHFLRLFMGSKWVWCCSGVCLCILLNCWIIVGRTWWIVSLWMKYAEKGRRYLRDLVESGRIKLWKFSEKYAVRMCTRFVWLQIGTSGLLWWTGNFDFSSNAEFFFFFKDGWVTVGLLIRTLLCVTLRR